MALKQTDDVQPNSKGFTRKANSLKVSRSDKMSSVTNSRKWRLHQFVSSDLIRLCHFLLILIAADYWTSSKQAQKWLASKWEVNQYTIINTTHECHTHTHTHTLLYNLCEVPHWCNAFPGTAFRLHLFTTESLNWKWLFTTKFCFLISYSPLDFLDWRFLEFLHGKPVIFKICAHVRWQPVKVHSWKNQNSKNFHPKLSTALCGIIQIFFIMLHAQYFQNTLIWARKLQHVRSSVLCCLLVLNIGELQLV